MYLLQVTGDSAVFPAVHITEPEVEHLVNILTEQADKYKRKCHKIQTGLGRSDKYKITKIGQLNLCRKN